MDLRVEVRNGELSLQLNRRFMGDGVHITLEGKDYWCMDMMVPSIFRYADKDAEDNEDIQQ